MADETMGLGPICRHCGNTGIVWNTLKPCKCLAGKAYAQIEQGNMTEAQRIIVDSLVAAQAQQLEQAHEPRAIIRHFAAAMERKLAANDGVKGGWRDYDWMPQYRALMGELCELLEAIQGLEDQQRFGVEESEARANVLDEAADCANYLMMICDVVGALPPTDERGR